ncbi:hypothetical protein EDD86DRAFT_203607 [Gorgonomyces haynaldii]|nr:hypothetical protein EDD86DRAFT_203607 [Gorgonomyces haynaldii]
MSFADMSKLHFNAGVCAMNLMDGQEAILAFTRAVELDSYMAIGFFQRAVCYYYLDEVENAIDDYEKAYKLMRENASIDYKQIGLQYKLHASHIVFNIALCLIVLGDAERGVRYFKDALDAAGDDKDVDTETIREAYRAGPDAPLQFYPFEMPQNVLYRPQEDNIKNAKKVDYMGKSVVVAGASQKDGFAGFSGRKIKELTLGRGYHKKNKRDTQFMKRNMDKAYRYQEPVSRSDTLVRRAPTLKRNNSSNSIDERQKTQPRTQGKPLGRQSSFQQRTASIRRPSDASRPKEQTRQHRRSLSEPSYDYDTLDSRNQRQDWADPLGDDPYDTIPRRTTERRPSDARRRPSDDRGRERPADRREPSRSRREPSRSRTQDRREPSRSRTQDRREPSRPRARPRDLSPEYDPYDTLRSAPSRKEMDMNNLRNTSPVRSPKSIASSAVPPDMIKVRAHWKDSRVVLVSQDVTLDTLLDKVAKKFKTNKPLSLKYRDEDGDIVVMSNEDDLDEALDTSPPGKLEVWVFLPDD